MSDFADTSAVTGKFDLQVSGQPRWTNCHSILWTTSPALDRAKVSEWALQSWEYVSIHNRGVGMDRFAIDLIARGSQYADFESAGSASAG
jgi:hypothetical protein